MATTVSRGYKTEIYGCIENVLQDSCCQAPKKNPTIIELLSEVYFSRSFGGAKPRNPNSSSKIGPPNSTKNSKMKIPRGSYLNMYREGLFPKMRNAVSNVARLLITRINITAR